MSEENEPIVSEQDDVPPLSHQRILAIMAAVGILGSLLGFIYVDWQFGLGFLIGSVLAFVNYLWLKQSLKKIFARALTGEKPRFLATHYVLRYVGFGALLLVIYLTETVSVIGVILGLASFALAIMFEGFIRIFSSLFNKKDI